MKYIVQFLLLVFCTIAHASELNMLSDLASLQWKYRIIVINDVENEEKVLSLLEKHTTEINDRDIAWYIIKQDRILTNFSGEISQDFLSNTRERYGARQGNVILIGKDGDIKSRLDHVDLEAIFSKIDAMPMRQYEMQN